MLTWPKNPRIYEINTLVWLREMSAARGSDISLATVPKEAWNALAELGMDAVWLMGVWERSPLGRKIALEHPGIGDDYRTGLEDLHEEDVLGSPYCVHRYEVDGRLGGRQGLAHARKELAKRGILLVLDYVPNHVAIDHPWVSAHPEYLIAGDDQDLDEDPAAFVRLHDGVFALGRDPYFPAWTDVLQLNAFHRGVRDASIDTVREIASQCDGMRCDMAMLVMNDVFERTWGEHAGPPPEEEYWQEVILAVREDFPDVLFLAEAYWDLEWSLLQQGFDYCYDKRLYDRLVRGNAEGVRLHLTADTGYQERLVRFMENHDEPRAASVFEEGRAMAAAVSVATLPGARLFHEGQFEGRIVRVPVQLGRRPHEEENGRLRAFYERLLGATRTDLMSRGAWSLCEVAGWPDNLTCRNLLAWCWLKDEQRCLVVINLSGRKAQGRVHLPSLGLSEGLWRLTDCMGAGVFDRQGTDIASSGLYVDLGPWEYHVLRFERR